MKSHSLCLLRHASVEFRLFVKVTTRCLEYLLPFDGTDHEFTTLWNGPQVYIQIKIWFDLPLFHQSWLSGNFHAFISGPRKGSKFRAPCTFSIRLSKCLWILVQTTGTVCSKRRRVLWRNVNVVGKWDCYFPAYIDLRTSLNEQPSYKRVRVYFLILISGTIISSRHHRVRVLSTGGPLRSHAGRGQAGHSGSHGLWALADGASSSVPSVWPPSATLQRPAGAAEAVSVPSTQAPTPSCSLHPHLRATALAPTALCCWVVRVRVKVEVKVTDIIFRFDFSGGEFEKIAKCERCHFMCVSVCMCVPVRELKKKVFPLPDIFFFSARKKACYTKLWLTWLRV